MWKKLKRLFNDPTTNDAVSEKDSLALQQQIQSLKLELAEREQTIAGLNQRLEKQRSNENKLAGEKARAQMESLVAEASAPAVQLLTLAHLSESAGKTLQVRDVLMVAMRLVHALENHGMTAEDKIGEVVAFEPNRHELLAQAGGIKPGDPVQIRFSSIAFQGKLLRKAGVSAIQESTGNEEN